MQKKVIAFITSLCIVITCSAPSYAIDIANSSANSLPSPRFPAQAISAPVGTLANGDTVAPVSSSDNIYYSTGNSNSTLYKTVSSWASLMSGITQGFALSISSLSSQLKSAISSQTTSINTGLTNVENAIDDVWTRLGVILGSVDQLEGYVDGLESYLNSISGSVDGVEGKLDTNNTSLSNIKTDTGNIYSLLNSGSFSDVTVVNDNFEKWLTPGWGKFDQYYYNPSTFAETYRLWDITNSTSYLYILLDSIVKLGNTEATALKVSMWRGNKSYLDDNLTQQTGEWTNSYNNAFIFYFQQLQADLKKLRYVLASDEEIEARQAASDNQSSAVDNFIKPSGNGSASASDIGEMANVSSSFSDMLSSGVSPSTAFSSMQSGSDAWSWFSQENADSLDQRGNRRRLLKSNSHSYVSDYYKELESIIGVKLW